MNNFEKDLFDPPPRLNPTMYATQNGPGSNDNEEVIYTNQSFGTGASPSDAVYLGLFHTCRLGNHIFTELNEKIVAQEKTT